jgi:hypothetical protein
LIYTPFGCCFLPRSFFPYLHFLPLKPVSVPLSWDLDLNVFLLPKFFCRSCCPGLLLLESSLVSVLRLSLGGSSVPSPPQASAHPGIPVPTSRSTAHPSERRLVQGLHSAQPRAAPRSGSSRSGARSARSGAPVRLRSHTRSGLALLLFCCSLCFAQAVFGSSPGSSSARRTALGPLIARAGANFDFDSVLISSVAPLVWFVAGED